MTKAKKPAKRRTSIFTKISILFKRLLIKLFFNKEEKEMDVIYATLIVNGFKTYDQVPAVIKPRVKTVLENLGFPELAVESN